MTGPSGTTTLSLTLTAFWPLATDGVAVIDEDEDEDDRSEWHNNPFTLHSYLTTDSVVISDDDDDDRGGGGGDDDVDDDGDDDGGDYDGDDADDDDRSEWQNNPYIRGANSYLATGVPLELHDVLRQPLPSIHVSMQLRTPPPQQPYVSVHTHQRPPPRCG